jgi:hydroxyacylglutathione hydrolase
MFALGCGRLFEGDAPTMWRSLGKLAALPDATRVYCGHEYTQSNARFALTADPDNEALGRRAAEIDATRAQGRPTIPSTIGSEKATSPFLRAGDPAIRRRLGLEGASDAEVFAEIRRRKDRA